MISEIGMQGVRDKVQIVVLCVGLLCSSLCVFSTADSDEMADQHWEQIQQLIKQEDHRKAHQEMIRMSHDFQNDWRPSVSLGVSYFDDRNFLESAKYLDETIVRLLRAGGTSEQVVAVRYQLLQAYEEIGRQYHFSPELCLRMLYHFEHIWQDMQASPRYAVDFPSLVQWAKQVLDRLKLAEVSVIVRVKDPNEIPLRLNSPGEPLYFALHEDGIDSATKQSARESVVNRLLSYP